MNARAAQPPQVREASRRKNSKIAFDKPTKESRVYEWNELKRATRNPKHRTGRRSGMLVAVPVLSLMFWLQPPRTLATEGGGNPGAGDEATSITLTLCDLNSSGSAADSTGTASPVASLCCRLDPYGYGDVGFGLNVSSGTFNWTLTLDGNWVDGSPFDSTYSTNKLQLAAGGGPSYTWTGPPRRAIRHRQTGPFCTAMRNQL